MSTAINQEYDIAQKIYNSDMKDAKHKYNNYGKAAAFNYMISRGYTIQAVKDKLLAWQ